MKSDRERAIENLGVCAICLSEPCECDDYDYEDDPVTTAYEEALMNCGMDRHGYCSKAGSEECDWDCPFSR